jgi:hypothetical protein
LQVRSPQELALAALDLEHVAQIPRVEEQFLLGLAAALFRRAERHAVQAT